MTLYLLPQKLNRILSVIFQLISGVQCQGLTEDSSVKKKENTESDYTTFTLKGLSD